MEEATAQISHLGTRVWPLGSFDWHDSFRDQAWVARRLLLGVVTAGGVRGARSFGRLGDFGGIDGLIAKIATSPTATLEADLLFGGAQ